MSGLTYIDARWAGVLADVTAGLALYGWTVNADGTVVLDDQAKNSPGIVGVAGGRVATLDGASYVAPRSTSVVPMPANLTDPGVQHMVAFAGVWADVSTPPVVVNLDAFRARFTDAESAAMAAAITASPKMGVLLAAVNAVGHVPLEDPRLKTWLEAFPAGTISADRITTVLTP